MGDTAENERDIAACNECGKTYPVSVSSEGDIMPIGIGECRSCGGDEFTVLEDTSSQAFAAED